MSKFFAGGSSSEEEDSDVSSDHEEDVQEQQVKPPARFMKGAGSDSDDDDSEPEKRVVKSTRDRRFDELTTAINSVRNQIKISNWKGVEDEFDKMNKVFTKAANIIQKEGIPKSYFSILAELEDFLKETQEKKDKVKLAGPNAKAFNSMKQKIKKHNKQYEKEIENFRANPNEEEKPAESDKDVSDDDDDVQFEREEPSDEDKDESAESDEDESFTTVQKGKPKKDQKAVKVEKKVTEMKPEEVRAKIKEILSDRGRLKSEPTKQVDRFNELFVFAKEPELQVEILVHTVSAQFDITRSVSTHMTVVLWKSTYQNLIKILDILEANPSVGLHESDEPEQAVDNDSDDNKMVTGNLMAFVERLDDEFVKSLQSIDPHTQEYVTRLSDEVNFLDLAERAQAYYEKANKMKRASRIAARRVEHLYYKLDLPDAKPAESSESVKKTVDVESLLEKLTHMIYTFGDERLKTRTILCHIFYHALQGRFYEARDMLLMSHLQESINHMDISTQVLFNRAMVQLGLCAFRNNLIKQAHDCLSETYSTGRVKELLAQGITNTRQHEKNPEQEKLERKRQLPFHMHINLELLEAVHLITALLLEVPNMAINAYDPKKKIISRTFRRLLDYYDRQVFNGPAENTRDVIITASKALASGDWRRSEQLLLGLNVWNLLPNTDQVKAMLRSRLQEEGLRTYIFTYGQHYDSLSLEQLTHMFELKNTAIHQIISKMMINEEIHASWDQPTGSIIMHKGVDPSRLQYLTLQFSEKAAQFVENNERLLDTRTGGYGYKFDQKPQKDGQNQQKRNDGQQRQDGQNQAKKPYNKNQNQNQNQNKRQNNQRGNNNNNRNRNSIEQQ